MSFVKYWVWLAECLGYGNNKGKILLNHFKTPEGVFEANIREITLVCELSKYEYSAISRKSLKKAQDIMAKCKELGIGIICYGDKRYPQRLRNIPAPPLCLYYKGDFPRFDVLPTVCIVGTRKADDYSIKAAWSLSARLALANFLVVSGGAMGIDSAAHRGCLDTGNETVALLACGINYPYLIQNEKLREEISSNGCLISEFPPDYPVKKSAFHIRNRLMSGLSLGTVVIEAGEKSGALITASNAAEQGRDVFVITGKPDDMKYAGSYKLLREGAIPVFKAEDIALEYYHSFGDIIDIEKANNYPLGKLYNRLYNHEVTSLNRSEIALETVQNSTVQKNIFKNTKETLSKNAEIVYNCINSDFFTIDDLSVTELDFNDIFSAVTELELTGLIKAVPGGRFLKIQQGE